MAPPGEDRHDSEARQQVGDVLAKLSRADLTDSKERAQLLAALARALAASARAAGAAAVAGGRWLGDTFVEAAPRLPVRDVGALHAQHPGLSDDAIAERLTTTAVRATTAVGVA